MGSGKILEQMVRNYREVAEDLGRSPSRAEYLAHPLHKFSQKKIRTYFGTWIQLMRAAGSTPSKMANTYKVDLPPKLAPKILLIDIETKPLISYTWGIFDQNVGLNQIAEDWSIISYSAKWLGGEEIFYKDLRHKKDLTDDKELLEEIWILFNEADIVLGQNSKAFDVKKIQARMAIHKMRPPSQFKQIDTKILAKRHFAFTSNKLEYLAQKLCKTRKLTNRKFQGFELWRECIAGNLAAWEEMREYNCIDVLALEELYLALAPWGVGIDFNIYRTESGFKCNCGSDSFTKSPDFHYAPTGVFEKWSCDSCGAWCHSKGKDNNLISNRKRLSLRGPS